ncbi:MAG TPA: hypothetical protein PKV98_17395, partial [Burkholderiaceae bacterium]|nr:hypothetical protein [Burkholderiaceae bacterium]
METAFWTVRQLAVARTLQRTRNARARVERTLDGLEALTLDARVERGSAERAWTSRARRLAPTAGEDITPVKCRR